MSVSYYLLAKEGTTVHVYQLPDNCEHLMENYEDLIESISESISKADELIEMGGDEATQLKIEVGLTGADLSALAEIVKSVRGIVVSAKVEEDSLKVAVETYSPEVLLAGIILAGGLANWRYASKTLYVAIMVWALSQLYERIKIVSEHEYDEFEENPTRIWPDVKRIIKKGKL